MVSTSITRGPDSHTSTWIWPGVRPKVEINMPAIQQHLRLEVKNEKLSMVLKLLAFPSVI
jgi:hypothetical protein